MAVYGNIMLMKKTLPTIICTALLEIPAVLFADYTHYYLIGSDAGNNCPLDGRGSPRGWSLAADSAAQESTSATDPNGIYHINGMDGGRTGNTSGSNAYPGVIRGALATASANYTFAGHQLVFDGFCPAMQVRQENGKTITFGNVLVVAGVNGEFRNGQGSKTPIVAGSNWVVEEGATLGLSACEGARGITCSATITGGGKLAAVGGLDEWRGYMATGSGKGTTRTVTFNGDLSAFEGLFSAGERSNCDLAYGTYSHADCVNGLTCVIATPSAFPTNTPDGALLEGAVVVTNGATIRFSCDVTSPANRGWDFGDGAQPTVNVDSGKTLTIKGPVKGTAGLKKTGSGTLVFDMSGVAPVTLTGTTTLSAAELAAYAALSTAWAKGELLDVTGAPDAYGETSPNYGHVCGVAAGEEVAVSCPAAYTNVSVTVAASCTGWKLYDIEGHVVSSGVERAFTYVHPTPAAYRRLEWQWLAETQSAAGAGGTVSGGFYSPGDTVTLTATPNQGHTFFRWTGDIGNADPAEPTITFTATSADPVTALFGNEIVVNADGSGDYPTLNAAVAAAADYDTIVLTDGQHTNATPAFVVIDKSVKVMSRNGRETTFFKSIKVPNNNTIYVNPAHKGIQVNNALAIVKGITFYNFGCDGRQTPQGLGIYLQQGLVEYCTISNTLPNHGASALHMTGGETRHSLIAYNRSNNNQNAPGAGVYLEGGTITNCVIRGNRAWKNHGGGIYVNGATARATDCVIDGNVCDYDDNKPRHGGGVYLANGLVENCVVTNNTAAIAAGVCQAGGTLRDCLVRDNHSTGSYGGVYSTGGAIADCVVADNTAKNSGGQALCKTAGSITGTTVIESLHAIPGSAIVSVDPSVTVTDCEFQCPCENIDGATEINASLFYATGDCYVEASRVVGTAPLAIDFTAHCLGDASAAAWDFGDGGTASGATASHTFANPGVFTVALTVGAESATLDIHILPTDTYVSTTGSDEFPYDTWEKAAHDLQSAIDAAYADDNVVGTVHVAAGDYTYTGANRNNSNTPWFLVAKPLSVVGPEEGRALFDGKNNTRGMYLFHSQASIRNLTFYRCRNGQNGGPYIGGALYMTGGSVSNCSIITCHGNYDGAVTAEGGWLQDCFFATNSCNPSGDDRRGAGLQITGAATATGCLFEKNAGGFGGAAYMNHASAVISNCVFRGNSAESCGGGALTIDAGLLTHCVITNNTSKGAGGALQMRNNSSYVRNCVVAFNKSTHTGSSYGVNNGKAGGGGVAMTGGTVENCTFYGNVSSSQTRCDELSMDGGSVRNCIFVGTDAVAANDVRKSGGTATHCFFRTSVDGTGNNDPATASDAKLKNPTTGDFSLLFGSPCIDAGMEIAAVATDIRGAVRPADGDKDGTAAWDIGAYEMDFAGQMVASFEADVTDGHGETTVTFTASVDGGTAPYTYRWTIGGVIYETSENTFTHTFSFGAHDVALDIEDATGATAETVVRTGLVSIKSPVVHVSTTGSGVWPYDTWEKATADWTLAVGAVYATDAEPGRILVADGTYTRHDTDNFTANLTLPIEFAGTNAACGAVFDGESTYHKIVCVNNAKAKVANLKFINVKGRYGDDSGGLWLYAGMVSNCVFSVGSADGAGMIRQEGGLFCDSVVERNNAGTHSGGDRYGGGLYMLGGTAERLIIQNCIDGAGGGVRVHGATAILRDSVIRGNYSETGGAVLLDTGLVENCVISNNTGKGSANSNLSPNLAIAGTGAYVIGGILRNCLIVDNRVTSDSTSELAGALAVRGGAAYNNTAWGNTLKAGTTNDIYQASGTAKNNLAGVFATVGGTADHNYAGTDPGFKNLAAGDFSLRGGSPCVNAGDWTVWGATRTEAKAFHDLDGAPRLVGPEVDIGCFEAQTSFTMLMLR